MRIKELEWKEPKTGGFIATGIEPLEACVSDGCPKSYWCLSHPDSEGNGTFIEGFAHSVDEAKAACNAAHAKLFEGWVIE